LRIAPGCQDHDDHEDGDVVRKSAAKPVQWTKPGYEGGGSTVAAKLIGFNDFHGQLSTGRVVGGRPVGGAAILASYIETAVADFSGRSLIIHAGDHVGASPPASALLQDEPAIQFLNLLSNRHCRGAARPSQHCNVIGTLGNHEFDEGRDELMRLVYGGNHPAGPFLTPAYPGADFPYVSSNVVDEDTGATLMPSYVVTQLGGVRVGVIGAVLEQTPTVVTPTGVAGLEFQDEADAINRTVAKLKKCGVAAIVVTIHQGGTQTSYTGETSPDVAAVSGPITDIVTRLDSAVDVVISGHAHAFTNALLPNAAGHPILVTQSFSASTAFADIDLTLDRATGDVVAKSASIVTTYGDEGPGLTPHAAVAELVAAAEQAVAPLVSEVVAVSAAAITRTQSAAGESSLGNLIADAQRSAMGTDFAFMNPGGIRADLDAGDVTWGELFTIQPFGNSLVAMALTGEQLYRLLEQQWVGQSSPRMLQISGLEYTWDDALPAGERIVEIRQDGVPIDLDAIYTVTANSFIAAGGDNFTVFTEALDPVGGPIDLDALIGHVEGLTQPFSAPAIGRITLQ